MSSHIYTVLEISFQRGLKCDVSASLCYFIYMNIDFLYFLPYDKAARGPCHPCFDLDLDLRAGNRDEQMAEWWHWIRLSGRAGPHPRRTHAVPVAPWNRWGFCTMPTRELLRSLWKIAAGLWDKKKFLMSSRNSSTISQLCSKYWITLSCKATYFY